MPLTKSSLMFAGQTDGASSGSREKRCKNRPQNGR